MATRHPGMKLGESVADWQDRRFAELRSFYNARGTKDGEFMLAYAARAIDALGEKYGMAYLVFDLCAMVGKLSRRIEELEQRGGDDVMSYAGVWESGAVYSKGEVVTHGGTIWYCHETTKDRPGTSEAWQMMAKSR